MACDVRLCQRGRQCFSFAMQDAPPVAIPVAERVLIFLVLGLGCSPDTKTHISVGVLTEERRLLPQTRSVGGISWRVGRFCRLGTLGRCSEKVWILTITRRAGGG